MVSQCASLCAKLLLAMLAASCLHATMAQNGNGNGNGNGNDNNGNDRSWNYHDAGSKAEAMDKVHTSGLAALTAADFSEAAQGASQLDASGGSRGSQKLRSMFKDWAQSYGVSFSNGQERQAAFQNFAASMAQVQQVNGDPNVPYWASGNAFSHLSFQQFSSQYLMNTEVMGSTPPEGNTEAWNPSQNRKLLQTPSSVNWVTAGKVPPVRNQGQCGSCWAFAATAAIESMYLIKVGGSVDGINLSEQQLVSCVNSANGYNGNGCAGGWSDQAMNYVAGINQTTEINYPYSATTGTCDKGLIASTVTGQVVKLSGYTKRIAASQSYLMAAVASAPTVHYFSVDSYFQSYAGGVYAASTCSNSINHAMVAVGYDYTNRFWIIRNSWGAGWGESGYARVRMTGTSAGPCGMHQYAYLPPSTFVKTLA